jgi:murein DD-endopeptidase MepM/ murein hydrolase activator NlpD
VKQILTLIITAQILIANVEFSFARELSNADATAVIEEAWNASYIYAPMMGSYNVAESSAGSDGQGFLTPSHYRYIKALSDAGLITIERDQQYENYKKGDSFSWDNFFEQSQHGLMARIILRPTELGQSFADPQERGLLRLPEGVFRITQIVQNEPRNLGVDEFAMLKFKYDADWNVHFQKYLANNGVRVDRQRKAIVLLRWDDFEGTWILVAQDVANLSDDFATDTVNNWLQGLKTELGTSNRDLALAQLRRAVGSGQNSGTQQPSDSGTTKPLLPKIIKQRLTGFNQLSFRHGTICKGYYKGTPDGAHHNVGLYLPSVDWSGDHDFTKTLIHPGVDLGADEGTAIPAILPGTVVDIIDSAEDANFRSLGYMVMIRSRFADVGTPLYSMYLHLEAKPLVAIDQKVEQGDVIGNVGKTGFASSYPHVHIEVRTFPDRFFTSWGNIYGTIEPTSLANYSRSDFIQNWIDPAEFFEVDDESTLASASAVITVGVGNDALAWPNGTYVYHDRQETAKEIDFTENIITISGDEFSYEMRYRSELRPSSPPWGAPALKNVRKCGNTKRFSGKLIDISSDSFKVKIQKEEITESDPPGWQKIGTQWKLVHPTWTFVRSGDGIADSRNRNTTFTQLK